MRAVVLGAGVLGACVFVEPDPPSVVPSCEQQRTGSDWGSGSAAGCPAPSSGSASGVGYALGMVFFTLQSGTTGPVACSVQQLDFSKGTFFHVPNPATGGTSYTFVQVTIGSTVVEMSYAVANGLVSVTLDAVDKIDTQYTSDMKWWWLWPSGSDGHHVQALVSADGTTYRPLSDVSVDLGTASTTGPAMITFGLGANPAATATSSATFGAWNICPP